MRIALISTVPIFPCTGGNRARLLNLSQSMRNLGHDVEFIFLPSRRAGEADWQAHHDYFGAQGVHRLEREGLRDSLYMITRVARRTTRKIYGALGSDRSHYYGLDEIFYTGFLPQLRDLHAARDYDAAIVIYVFNSKALDAFPDSVLKVIDTHDAFTDRHKLFEAAGRAHAGYSLRGADEARGLERSHAVMAIQEREAVDFRELTNGTPTRVVTISHTLDRSRKVESPARRSACFIGSDFEANVVSLRYFIDQVMPLVLAVRPDFKLYVAGSVCNAVEDHPAIVKMGRVPHVADAMERGGILINPIVLGTGINIKLLDALACGVPVVSTEFGARGLEESGNGAVLTVPDWDAAGFSRLLLTLMTDDDLWRAASTRASQAAEDWDETQMRALGSVLSTKPVELRKPKAFFFGNNPIRWWTFLGRPRVR